MANILFVDTRTGEIKERFSVLEARFMRKLEDKDIVNNTEKEIKKMIKKEKILRKIKGF